MNVFPLETVESICKEMKTYRNAEAWTEDYEFVSMDELSDRILSAFKAEMKAIIAQYEKHRHAE